MPHVETAIGRLYVEERGTGAPVALWPSLLTDGSMWRAQADDLARDHRVVVIDPPGHGRSDPPPGDFTIWDCATALGQVLDAHRIDSAVLGGLSWGGMTAMRFAIANPGRVRALALFDTSARPDRLMNRLRYSAMAAVYRRWGMVGPIRSAALEAMLGPTTRRERPELGRELVARVATWGREGVVRAVRAVLLRRDSILEPLGRLAVPTLVAIGEEDRTTPLVEAERIAGAIPGARLVRIPRAGHLSSLEAPGEVTRLLRELLD